MSSKLDKLKALFEVIRDQEEEFPPQSMVMLLLVAEAGPEGIVLKDLGDKVGLSLGAVSRNVAKLADWHNGVEGFGFIKVDFVPGNYRQKHATLTQKGERWLKLLTDKL